MLSVWTRTRAMKEIRNKEIWKDIARYEGLYQVSNLGRVRSLDRIAPHPKGQCRRKGKLLRPILSNTVRYYQINLYCDGNHKLKLVHRLVLAAFIPSIKGKDYCNHKNGNKLDNRIENLEWVNKSENQFHAYQTGLKQKSPKSGTPPIPVKCIQTGENLKA